MASEELEGDAREERLAQNEVLFRSVNEAIEEQAVKFGGLDAYEFICECASRDCFERIRLTLEEYERVRADGASFLVAPGHDDVSIELVVAKLDTHWIVRKDGAAGAVAEFSDPRDADAV